jgi:hypothetical protein
MNARALLLAIAAAALAALAGPAAAPAHPERQVVYPDPASGPSRVVCKPDSAQRIRRIWRGSGPKNTRLRTKRLSMLRRCRHEHIQDAVNAARSGDRILVMPGVYREEPSRARPRNDPRCAGMFEEAFSTGASLQGQGNGAPVPTYEHHRRCPNARNLIAIIGDSDGDRICDDKCDLQIEGMGRFRQDVRITGDGDKENVIRGDRADGLFLKNFFVEFSDFNNVYVLETNGFRFADITSRWSYEYGFLSFVSDHGLYEDLTAYGAGDSGIYPGSGPQRDACDEYGIEVRRVKSFGNLLGYSGTAGDSIYVHDSQFFGNVVGISTDSFIGGHPGLPQDCSKFEDNEIFANNLGELFDDEHDEVCNSPGRLGGGRQRPQEDLRFVCPTFAAPVGTGVMIAGGSGNVVRDNRIYDNWREGVKLFWVPAAVRGEFEPEKQNDTSNDNAFTGNLMGVGPGGRRMPNGLDLWWDEQGSGNCWAGNRGHGTSPVTSDPPSLPACPQPDFLRPVNPAKSALLVPCALFDQRTNRDPIGCDWLETPPRPE